MKLIKGASKELTYRHFVLFSGKKYIREETVMPQSFRWESTPKDKLEDFHTISWSLRSLNENENIEYFSYPLGWSKDGRLDVQNPVPEIEKIFKETIGKNLIYF